MRKRKIVLAAAALAACSGHTGAGPVGRAIDLRQYLPDTLRTNTSEAAESTFTQRIPVGPDNAPVELTWTSYRHGPGRYVGRIEARLMSAVPYDSLTLGGLSDLANIGSKWAPEASAKIRVGWFKRGLIGRRSGEVDFTFDAGGRRAIGAEETR